MGNPGLAFPHSLCTNREGTQLLKGKHSPTGHRSNRKRIPVILKDYRSQTLDIPSPPIRMRTSSVLVFLPLLFPDAPGVGIFRRATFGSGLGSSGISWLFGDADVGRALASLPRDVGFAVKDELVEVALRFCGAVPGLLDPCVGVEPQLPIESVSSRQAWWKIEQRQSVN